MTRMSRRNALAAVGVTAAIGTAVSIGQRLLSPATVHAQAEDAADAAIPPGGVSLDQLGELLTAIGLEPKKTDSRYDFIFKLSKPEEWNLSMTTVLSNDNKTIWIMAWLDVLPSSAVDVPRSALLRLLADNDKLGNGQFFAYVSTNRRFVLQRVIPNNDITATSMKTCLKELGQTVINSYPHWNTQNWKKNDAAATEETSQNAEAAAETPAGRPASKTATREGSTRKQ